MGNLTAEPKVFSYWAGWSHTPIPNFAFNGLFMAFALMQSDQNGNYYTDYTASGNFQKFARADPIRSGTSGCEPIGIKGAGRMYPMAEPPIATGEAKLSMLRMISYLKWPAKSKPT